MKSFRIILITSLLIHSALQMAAQYSVEADTLQGCDSLRVAFSINPDPVDDGINSFLWNFGDGDSVSGSSTLDHLYDTTGVFKVTVLLAKNATLSLDEPVQVFPVPDSEFLFRDTLESGSYSFLFQAPGQEPDSLDYAFTWDFGDGNSGAGSRVFHSYEESGLYSVVLTTDASSGCSSQTAVNIRARDLLEIPNVFTPNEDGLNDFFRVITNGNDIYELSIYARTGLLIYRSESPLVEWDGRSFSGNMVQPGVYFFVIRQVSGDESFNESGFVHLLR